MKKLLITGLATLLFSGPKVFAQDEHMLAQQQIRIDNDRQALQRDERIWKEEKVAENFNDVNDFVKNQFAMDFPKAQKVSYRNEKPYPAVYFTMNGKHYKAFYNFDNRLIGTIRNVMVKDLPASAVKRVHKDYPDYTVTKVILFHDYKPNSDGMWLNNSAFQDKRDYFVKMKGQDKSVVLKVDREGDVSFFRTLA